MRSRYWLLTSSAAATLIFYSCVNYQIDGKDDNCVPCDVDGQRYCANTKRYFSDTSCYEWIKERTLQRESLDYTSIHGISENEIFVVGHDKNSNGFVFRFDGENLYEEDVGTVPRLNSVFVTLERNVFAVGGDEDENREGIIVHYDGVAWNKKSIGNGKVLNDVWGTSSSDIYAVGYSNDETGTRKKGLIMHYDGNGWVEMDVEADGEIMGIWGSSSTNVYAAANLYGDGECDWPDATVFNYDGNIWAVVESIECANFYDIWGASRDNVYAVGNVFIHFDGSLWESIYGCPMSTYYGLWVSDKNMVFAVGGTITIYTGAHCTDFVNCLLEDKLMGIWAMSDTQAWAVGENGIFLILKTCEL